MKPQLQRIAIAEACGWTRFGERCYSDDGAMEITGYKDGIWGDIPRYLTDLNAMHEAEKTFDLMSRLIYTKNLKLILKPEYVFERHGNQDWFDVFDFIHASISQRSEAFLRTIGKWENA